MITKNLKYTLVIFSFLFLLFSNQNAHAQKKCQALFDYVVHDTMNGYEFFFNGTSPNGNSFFWDFGDGKTSTTSYTADHHYAANGTYRVCLRRDSSGCKDTVCKSIKADKTNPCNAQFTALPNQSYPLMWSFVAKDTLEEKYNWNGSSGKNFTYNYTFSSKGSYKMQLIVSNSKDHCLDTVTKSFNVKECSAGFESYINHTNQSSLFADRSSANINVRQWIFGDGKTATKVRNPTHVYSKPGKYWVTLIATDSVSKCGDSSGMSITITDCSAKYTFGYKLTSSRTAEFVDSSKLSKYITSWNFGDASTSNTKKPTHTYAGPDYYRVNLFIYDSTNFCVDTVSKLVLITEMRTNCKAQFDIVNYSPYPYLNYGYFSYTNIPGVVHRWTIDGVTNSNTSAGFRYNYPKAGTYTICLYINDTIKKCKDSLCRTLSVGIPSKCTPGFKYTLKDSVLNFILDTLPKSTSVRWRFGDGTYSTSSSGKHTYKPGTYQLCATIYCSSTDSGETCTTIVVKSTKCKAGFSYSFKSTNKYKIEFNNLTSSSSTMFYQWYFGDGNSSTTANPVHTYKTGRNYTVCLLINDTFTKCRDTLCKTINLQSNCDSTFLASYTIHGDTVKFVYKGSAKIKYDFGNGTTATTNSAEVVYSKPGTYTVCIYSYCSSTDSSENCINITIKPKCQALFTVALDTTKKFKLFLINKSSKTSSTQYTWSFGDSTYSGLRNPTHKYNRFGKFEICLLVIDTAVNCSSKFCDTVNLDTSGKLLKMGAWELVVIDEEVFGIKKTLKADIKIYPNPADTKVTIVLGSSNVSYDKLEIINSSGQVCVNQEITKGAESLEVPLEGLTKGLYLIKLGGEQGYTYKKMIKN